MMPSKEERELQKRSLFRLIDSYQTENIRLALEIVKGNQSLRDACKNRYYPILRQLDAHLGKGFWGLFDVIGKLENPSSALPFFIFCLNYYQKLGEAEVVERLLHGSAKEYLQKISSVEQLQQLLEIPILPDDLLQEINFNRHSNTPLLLSPHLRSFAGLQKLVLTAVQHLEQFMPFFAGMKELKDLAISGCLIEALPKEIGSQTKLNRLNLSNNNLSDLPPDFAQLQQLQTLYLNQNRFKALPEVLRHIPSISNLWCCNTPLQGLPDWLPELSNLGTLYVTDNKMQGLSSSAFECPKLHDLYAYNNHFSSLKINAQQCSKSITWLELGRNDFSAFPSDLLLLEHLQHLHIHTCKIPSLPTEISCLTKLKWLNIKENKINELPDGIGSLARLEWLEAGTQPLQKIPESIGNLSELRGLSLRETNLSTLPDSMQNLQKLEHLDLRRTPIKEGSDMALQLKKWLPKCKVLVGYW